MIKILVVDDEKSICDLIDLNLSASGYHCQSVQNGLDAIDLIEKENFDLILLDIYLRKMDGYEVMEHIRRNPQLAKIPVILLTAAEQEDEERSFALGAVDFIRKPFDPQMLLSRIEAVWRMEE